MILQKKEKEDLARQRYHVISKKNKNLVAVVFAKSEKEAIGIWASKFNIPDSQINDASVTCLSYKSRKTKVNNTPKKVKETEN